VQSFKNSFKHYEILKRAKGAYNPKITFVVVQKRVSLRIFNTNLQSGEPGTVVDHTIVSSRFWDFYMLTTKPPNGKTSRPTRYIVVYDDYGISNVLKNF
ncbi:Piwi-like protein 2, partial [Bonamia ostreae]